MVTLIYVALLTITGLHIDRLGQTWYPGREGEGFSSLFPLPFPRATERTFSGLLLSTQGWIEHRDRTTFLLKWVVRFPESAQGSGCWVPRIATDPTSTLSSPTRDWRAEFSAQLKLITNQKHSLVDGDHLQEFQLYEYHFSSTDADETVAACSYAGTVLRTRPSPLKLKDAGLNLDAVHRIFCFNFQWLVYSGTIR